MLTPEQTIEIAQKLERIEREAWNALVAWLTNAAAETVENGVCLHNERGAVMDPQERAWAAGGAWHLKDLQEDLAALRSGEYRDWPEIRAHLALKATEGEEE